MVPESIIKKLQEHCDPGDYKILEYLLGQASASEKLTQLLNTTAELSELSTDESVIIQKSLKICRLEKGTLLEELKTCFSNIQAAKDATQSSLVKIEKEIETAQNTVKEKELQVQQLQQEISQNNNTIETKKREVDSTRNQFVKVETIVREYFTNLQTNLSSNS